MIRDLRAVGDRRFCRGALRIISRRASYPVYLFFRSVSSANCSIGRTMLHLVGLGLADEKDITVRGLEIVKKAERVYLEAYTAILLVDKAKLVS